jgi:hypothetical protein
VQAGDPDWRAYYTVNLLNLPGHYHNGGVWPFIGGMWVRFIHRLGLREVACRELLKARASESRREKSGMGIQRMDAQPHRPADGQGLSSVVRRLLHPRLPRTADEPGEPGQ